MANVIFKLVNNAEQASEAIQDRKLLYNYESKKIYVDSGTTTRIEFYGFIGTLSALTTVVKTSIVESINELVTNIGSLGSLLTTAKTSIVNAINEIFAKPKQAPTGTPVVVATSIVAGNVFTAPSNGVYQIKTAFSAGSGFAVFNQSNGEVYQINPPQTNGYSGYQRVPINTGQTLTVTTIGSVSSAEIKFFPMV